MGRRIRILILAVAAGLNLGVAPATSAPAQPITLDQIAPRVVFKARLQGSEVAASFRTTDSMSVVSPSTAAALHLQPDSRRIVRAASVSLGGQPMRGDLAAVPVLPPGIDLGLGTEMLKGVVVGLDFDGRTMTIEPRKSFLPPADATLAPLFLNSQGAPMVRVTFQGQGPVSAVFDLGDYLGLAVQSGHDNVLPGVKATAATGELRIGPVALADTSAIRLPFRDALSSQSAAVGLWAIEQFNVWLDLGGERLWLRPAPITAPGLHPLSSTIEAYLASDSTRLDMPTTCDDGAALPLPAALGFTVRQGEDGLVVLTVASDGRAAKAGLKPGDDIWLVNDNDPLSYFCRHRPWVETAVSLDLSDGRSMILPPH